MVKMETETEPFSKVVKNVCSICGKPIKVRRPKDRFLAKMLENSKTAVCKQCDSKSGWKEIKQ